MGVGAVMACGVRMTSKPSLLDRVQRFQAIGRNDQARHLPKCRLDYYATIVEADFI